MSFTLTSEEEELLRHLAYKDNRIGTRLNPDTLVAKVNLFRPRMVATALGQDTITYEELTSEFHDLAWQDIGQVLGLMGLFEDEHQRPLLPAVVVNDEPDPTPGDNYFVLVKKANQYGDVPPESDEESRNQMWQKHLKEVWKFKW